VVQPQKGKAIQLMDEGEAPEFPEGLAEGSSQLLLSATFLTAELALLQKFLNANIQDKMVSCPVLHPCLPLPWDWQSCLLCVSENNSGAVGSTRTGRC
jgi:hypothetical protein